MKPGPLFIATTLFTTAAFAGDNDYSAIKEALVRSIPEAAESVISKSPIVGLYQVDAKGHIFYVTADKKYVILGDVIELDTRKNLTETSRSTARIGQLTSLKEENMLIFKPKGDVKHTITVFTDTQCPYCRKMHNEIDSYLSEGIKVRYMFMPFKGDASFNQAVNIWCSKNPQTAYTDISNGKEIEPKTCSNPIAQHQSMAKVMGVQGTPAIVLEDGSILPGYLTAAKLLEQLSVRGL